MTQRTAKVESLIRQTVAGQVRELMEVAAAHVTVTAVDAAPDLRNATVWFGITAGNEDKVFAELLELRATIQRHLAKVMTTKFVPKLTFQLDSGGAYAQRIEQLMKGLSK
ncbi:MAG TPA: ribosome-binding factor A [Candidatus Saccharimonadales bacterium]|nr:ribosome-binding factor A [Candidatus Saccharimonadales bacterium]